MRDVHFEIRMKKDACGVPERWRMKPETLGSAMHGSDATVVPKEAMCYECYGAGML